MFVVQLVTQEEQGLLSVKIQMMQTFLLFDYDEQEQK
jgi:hypothetical protein